MNWSILIIKLLKDKYKDVLLKDEDSNGFFETSISIVMYLRKTYCNVLLKDYYCNVYFNTTKILI